MNKQQYSKSSLVGRIYYWYHGRYPGEARKLSDGSTYPTMGTDSCSVRRTILFLAPFEAVFGDKLTGFPLWFVWFTGLQIYALANWGVHVTGSEEFALLAAIYLIMFGVALIELGGIAWLVSQFLWGALENRVSVTISTPKQVKQSLEIAHDWWDDFYNKVCKPVEWVE